MGYEHITTEREKERCVIYMYPRNIRMSVNEKIFLCAERLQFFKFRNFQLFLNAFTAVKSYKYGISAHKGNDFDIEKVEF